MYVGKQGNNKKSFYRYPLEGEVFRFRGSFPPSGTTIPSELEENRRSSEGIRCCHADRKVCSLQHFSELKLSNAVRKHTDRALPGSRICELGEKLPSKVNSVYF